VTKNIFAPSEKMLHSRVPDSFDIIATNASIHHHQMLESRHAINRRATNKKSVIPNEGTLAKTEMNPSVKKARRGVPLQSMDADEQQFLTTQQQKVLANDNSSQFVLGSRTDDIPSNLKDPITGSLITNPSAVVVMPCCGYATLDTVYTTLLASQKCLLCGMEDVSADDLVVDLNVRAQIAASLAALKQRNAQQSATPVQKFQKPQYSLPSDHRGDASINLSKS